MRSKPMAKRPPPGRCVHCLGDFESLTWDHVLPVSWYPDTTPANLEKWKFPSCEPCNHRFSIIEQDLLIRFGICLTPGDLKSAGIPEKALRSTKPEFANDEKDRQARMSLRKKILSETTRHTVPPLEGVFPGFGPQPGVHYPEYITVPLPQASIKCLSEKILRGVSWKMDGNFITPNYEITTSILHDKDAWEVYGPMQGAGSILDLGPGFQIWRATVPENPIVSAVGVQIWGRVKLYSIVSLPESPAIPSTP